MRRPGYALVALGAILAPHLAAAQSSCSSDGQAMPRVLLERFINADCAACWRHGAAAPNPKSGVAIDWVLPGSLGDDAPLSAVASRDAALRLQALGQALQESAYSHISSTQNPASGTASTGKMPAATLRVARGVALGGYMGASIELSLRKPSSTAPNALDYPLTGWLVLAEEIPKGTEGSPVARLLVRNALIAPWNQRNLLFNSEQNTIQGKFTETRPMSLPEGTNPDKVRAVGWVQDARGRILAIAASVCH